MQRKAHVKMNCERTRVREHFVFARNTAQREHGMLRSQILDVEVEEDHIRILKHILLAL